MHHTLLLPHSYHTTILSLKHLPFLSRRLGFGAERLMVIRGYIITRTNWPSYILETYSWFCYSLTG